MFVGVCRLCVGVCLKASIKGRNPGRGKQSQKIKCVFVCLCVYVSVCVVYVCVWVCVCAHVSISKYKTTYPGIETLKNVALSSKGSTSLKSRSQVKCLIGSNVKADLEIFLFQIKNLHIIYFI